MSLLIKALDKAEKAQADKTKKAQSKRRPKALKTDFGSTGQFQAMSLAEPNADLLHTPPDSLAASNSAQPSGHDANPTQGNKQDISPAPSVASSAAAHPDRAANVFAAKRIEPSHQNAKLAMLGGIALLALLAMGWYVYQAVKVTEPAMPVRPAPSVAPIQNMPTVSEAANQTVPAETVALTHTQVSPKQDEIDTGKHVPDVAPTAKLPKTNVEKTDNEIFDVKAPVVAAEKVTKANIDTSGPVVASRSVSVSVSKVKPDTAVNPTLMRAYESYNAGNDSEAQVLYKQVLQHDVRNVDALLGLGAIATRQGRDADANGWYRKVLEVEPRNTIAQAAIIENQNPDQNGETRLKSLIEKSPNDADLHAKLGQWYAGQNQWAAAQQAYFEANRLNPNAENAFNLAVSLDQMGKPKLALPYYQKALETIGNNSSIDKGALEARVQAIQ